MIVSGLLPRAIDWGDLPTWISSVATVAALIAAGVAARVGFRLYRIESDRDQRAEEDRRLAAEDRRLAAEDRNRTDAERRTREEDSRQAQAKKVAAWWTSPHTILPDLQGSEWGAFVRNASDLPIYHVEVIFYTLSEPPDEDDGYVVRGTTDPPIQVLPPETTVFVRLPYDLDQLADDLADEEGMEVSVSFIDAAGNGWVREIFGPLGKME